MRISKEDLAKRGFFMPAEYAEQHGCLMIWPERPGSWGYGAKKAQEAFVRIALCIAESEELYMIVSEESLEAAVSSFGLKPEEAAVRTIVSDEEHAVYDYPEKKLHFIAAATDDAWARDTGATFVINSEKERCGIDWQFNAWGGEFDGLYANWDKDQKVAATITEVLGDKIADAGHFVLEGGSIHTDGEGTLLTTEECLLSKGRNPQLGREEIEAELKGYLGVSKIIWLPYGIYNDETNGHVDNFCCFAGPAKVLLAWTEDREDPQYERSRLAYEILTAATDAKGRSFEIIKLPIPEVPICITEDDLLGYEFEEGEDFREVGERLAASYVNFYIVNGCVLVPQFGDVNDSVALDIIGRCFPERKTVGIYARDILTGGGNIHCITQQIPEAAD